MDVTITNAGGRIEIVDLRNDLVNNYDVLKDGLRLLTIGNLVRITFIDNSVIEINYFEVELINAGVPVLPRNGSEFFDELNILLGDYGTGGGPGDVPTLQAVTDEGNSTDNNISFTDAGLLFDNGAKFKKGTTDSGLGGAKGVAQICSIDYELKWEAGRLYIMQQDGFTIREVRYNFTQIPNENDDFTKGFVVGSRWVLDNGNLYNCTDSTTGAAVWELETIGGGDMFKSVYDTDNDGNVDKAETVQIVVRNSTGSTLTKGQIVYLSGATGNRPNAVLAQANNVNSKKTIGWVTANIPNNSDGFVAVSGSAHDLNTSAFSAGDLLYLSSTVAGGITSTIPAHPNYEIFIGFCARSHPNFGRIIFKIAEVLEIESLHDVSITSVANNEGLFYEAASGLWKNKTIETVLGAASSSQNGYLSSTDWITFNNKALNYKSTTDGIATSTNNITLSHSVLIPAGTFAAGNIIRIYNRMRATGIGAAKTQRIYVNSTNDLIGATLLATNQSGSNVTVQGMKRDLIIKSSSNTEVFAATVAIATDDSSSNTFTNVTIDWTVNKYIIFTNQRGASGDVLVSSSYLIERL